MTREQAKREIDNIDFYLQHHTDDYSERSHDAMMMAIQALSREPISLDDINNALEASFRNGVRSVTQKSGNWIDYQKNGWIYAQCSECGEVHDSPSVYCPSCGAKMVEPQESEE